jgi:hypothetical protein
VRLALHGRRAHLATLRGQMRKVAIVCAIAQNARNAFVVEAETNTDRRRGAPRRGRAPRSAPRGGGDLDRAAVRRPWELMAEDLDPSPIATVFGCSTVILRRWKQ